MKDLKEPTVTELANDFLDNGKTALDQVVDSFRKLEFEDKKLIFGRLCQRTRQVTPLLIDLLFALGSLVNQRRAVTLRLLEEQWKSRRGEKGLAESMRQALAEQHAP